MKILEQKIGRFGWDIWMVQDGEGYKIGLLNVAKTELIIFYYMASNLDTIKCLWEKS